MKTMEVKVFREWFHVKMGPIKDDKLYKILRKAF